MPQPWKFSKKKGKTNSNNKKKKVSSQDNNCPKIKQSEWGSRCSQLTIKSQETKIPNWHALYEMMLKL